MAALDPAAPMALICLQMPDAVQRRRGPDWGALARYITPAPVVRLAGGYDAVRPAIAGHPFALAAAGDADRAFAVVRALADAGVAPCALLLLAPVLRQGAPDPGTIAIPTLVVSVHGETPSSPEILRARLMPHLPFGRMLAHDGPEDTLILRHGTAIGAVFSEIIMTDSGPPDARPAQQEPIGAEPAIDPVFAHLLASDHVSTRTRVVMEERGRSDPHDYAPRALTPEALAILREAAARVLPQDGVFDAAPIDLGARIDTRLATTGDGWRFADLPPDVQAYEQALHTLDQAARHRCGAAFVGLATGLQDDLLRRVADGTLEGNGLTADQMKLWFADLRADCVQVFITHPATMGRLGIDSVANGGDAAHQGFVEIGLGRRADWEPVGAASLGGDGA